MKTNDIVHILRQRLPKLTDSFNAKQNISSLTATAGLATATLAVANTVIQNGDKVLITGALVNNPITSLSHVAGLATAVTQNVHDLTEDYSTITISGATQAGYNGTFTLIDVIDEKTFTFNVDTGTVTPATGSPVLKEDTEIDFNGYQTITKIDTTHFTFPILNTASITAVGTPVLNYGFRIHGTADIERAITAYTAQTISDYVIYVETGDNVSDKSKSSSIDSNYFFKEGYDFSQNCIQEIRVYLIVNCKTDMLAPIFKDIMEDVRVLLFQSLLSLKLNNYLSQNSVSGISFKQDRKFLYDGAIYVHEFIFEAISEITKEDIAMPEEGVALRNISITYQKTNGDTMKTDTIKLP